VRILIGVSVFMITLCMGSFNVSPAQGIDMRLPTDGGAGVSGTSNPFSGLPPRGVDVSISRLPVSREPQVVMKGPLAVSDRDRADHAAFLNRPNTGLIRLLSPRVSQSSLNRQPPVKINGDGAYYSFNYRSHEYGYGSDLQLTTGFVVTNGVPQPPHHELSVGFAGADFGMLTNLGSTPLETLTVDDARANFMRAYKPPQAESKARGEYHRFQLGVTIGNATYKSKLPIQIGATYLLRSIVYDKSDVLVAFQVVRQDPDQSFIIAWKLLKQFGTPALNKSK
jgi:hypothetical protein